MDKNTKLHKLQFLWSLLPLMPYLKKMIQQGIDYLRPILGSEIFFLFEIVIPKFIRLDV